MTLTEDGADFSEGAAPTIHDALRMPQLSLGSTSGGTGDEVGKGKGKGKGRKGKGKGRNENGDGDANTESKPDKVLSPLDKAKLLRKSVFLRQLWSIYLLFLSYVIKNGICEFVSNPGSSQDIDITITCMFFLHMVFV